MIDDPRWTPALRDEVQLVYLRLHRARTRRAAWRTPKRYTMAGLLVEPGKKARITTWAEDRQARAKP